MLALLTGCLAAIAQGIPLTLATSILMRIGSILMITIFIGGNPMSDSATSHGMTSELVSGITQMHVRMS